jgi:hypothetical protein
MNNLQVIVYLLNTIGNGSIFAVAVKIHYHLHNVICISSGGKPPMAADIFFRMDGNNHPDNIEKVSFGNW